MKRGLLASLLMFTVLVASCAPAASGSPSGDSSAGPASETETTASYQQISPDEAKEMMDDEGAIILDVRTPEEFAEGHIPGAVNLELGTFDQYAAEVIPDKDAILLVYCRSGNRSKTASETLVSMGYTKVYEFGGIIDWPYETVVE